MTTDDKIGYVLMFTCVLTVLFVGTFWVYSAYQPFDRVFSVCRELAKEVSTSPELTKCLEKLK